MLCSIGLSVRLAVIFRLYCPGIMVVYFGGDLIAVFVEQLNSITAAESGTGGVYLLFMRCSIIEPIFVSGVLPVICALNASKYAVISWPFVSSGAETIYILSR